MRLLKTIASSSDYCNRDRSQCDADHVAQHESQDKPEPPKIIRKSGGVLQGSATKRVEPALSTIGESRARERLSRRRSDYRRRGKGVRGASDFGSSVAQRRRGIGCKRVDVYANGANGCAGKGHRHDHIQFQSGLQEGNQIGQERVGCQAQLSATPL